MSVQISNMAAEMAALRAAVNDFETEAVGELKHATRVTLEALFSQTPVWSGETVAAYGIGIGIGAQTAGSPAGYFGGEPGPTSSQPLGAENNRPGAEAVARAHVESSLASLKKLTDVYFGNGVDAVKWNLVDSGQAPNKDAARNPAGVQKPAEVIAKARLGGIVV